MYLQNKYTSYYYKIINRAKSRTLPENIYKEKHHIIPKSLGGSNHIENIAVLTLREHFICHKLLTRMVTGKNKTKMIYGYRAFIMASPRRPELKINSREFEKIRTLGLRKGQITPDSTKEKISKANKGKLSGNNNPMFGKTHSEHSRKKISESRKSKSNLPDWNIRPPCSKEKANKIKLANTGKRWVHNKLTGERKYLDPSLVNNYLKDGWDLGLGPKTISQTHH